MIGLPTPDEYAELSYSQRVLILDRLDRLRRAYLYTERPNGQIRRPVPTRPLQRPRDYVCTNPEHRACTGCDEGRR